MLCYKANFAIKLNFCKNEYWFFFIKKKDVIWWENRRRISIECITENFFFLSSFENKNSIIYLELEKYDKDKFNLKILLFLGFVKLNYLKKKWTKNNIWHNIRKLFIKKDHFKKKCILLLLKQSFCSGTVELVLIEFIAQHAESDLLKIVLLVKGCYDLYLLVSSGCTDYKGFLNIQNLFLLCRINSLLLRIFSLQSVWNCYHYFLLKNYFIISI